MIRDEKNHICSLHLQDKKINIKDNIVLFIDFTKNALRCFSVKATLYQLEKRAAHDSNKEETSYTLLNEVPISSVLKPCIDAEYINLQLFFPDDAPYPFETSSLVVSYHISVEFIILNTCDNKNDEEMNMMFFSIPLKVEDPSVSSESKPMLPDAILGYNHLPSFY